MNLMVQLAHALGPYKLPHHLLLRDQSVLTLLHQVEQQRLGLHPERLWSQPTLRLVLLLLLLLLSLSLLCSGQPPRAAATALLSQCRPAAESFEDGALCGLLSGISHLLVVFFRLHRHLGT